MPSLGQVLSKQAHAPAAPPPSSPAGKQAVWPRSADRGKPSSQALQTHERLYEPAYDTSDASRYESASRATFSAAALERHVPGAATLSDRVLQAEDALETGDESGPSDLRFRSGLRAAARPPRQFRDGCGKAGPRCVTGRMRLTSRDLQAHAPIFKERPLEAPAGPRFVTATAAAHTGAPPGDPAKQQLSHERLQRSAGVAAAVAFPGEAPRYAPESGAYRSHDHAAVRAPGEAGRGSAASGVDRIRKTRDAWS